MHLFQYWVLTSICYWVKMLKKTDNRLASSLNETLRYMTKCDWVVVTQHSCYNLIYRDMKNMSTGWRKLVTLSSYKDKIILLFLSMELADAITPLLDSSPVNFHKLFSGGIYDRVYSLKSICSILKMG